MGKRFGEMTPISIHALQTECDPKRAEPMETIIISIHALQTECDSLLHTLLFQCQYFYPRTPNGVRPLTAGYIAGVRYISIHALQTECD